MPTLSPSTVAMLTTVAFGLSLAVAALRAAWASVSPEVIARWPRVGHTLDGASLAVRIIGQLAAQLLTALHGAVVGAPWPPGPRLPSAPSAARRSVVSTLLFLPVLAFVACATTGVPGAPPIVQTDAVLHEIVQGIGDVDTIVHTDVNDVRPPPANLATINQVLADVSQGNTELGSAVAVFDAAVGAAKESAGCAIRPIADRVLGLLVQTVTLLQAVGLPVPSLVSTILQGIGLLIDAVAPNCPATPGASALYAAGGAHAYAMTLLSSHGLPAAPVPAGWSALAGGH